MKSFTRIFLAWLPLAVASTGVCLLVYATVQQNYRQSLNDPQIQMAEDGAAALAAGGTPASLVQRGVPLIDIAESLSPWIALYDASGTPLESSGVLDGEPPMPPQGVLDAARSGLPLIVGHHITPSIPPNENRVSWQPRSDVRQAIVVVSVASGTDKGYFVVAGRNMREVERREATLSYTVLLAWIALIIATFLTKAFEAYLV